MSFFIAFFAHSTGCNFASVCENERKRKKTDTTVDNTISPWLEREFKNHLVSISALWSNLKGVAPSARPNRIVYIDIGVDGTRFAKSKQETPFQFYKIDFPGFVWP